MIIFPLKKEWYEKIKSGEKKIEYREVKPYWEKRLTVKIFDFIKTEIGTELEPKELDCFFSCGYGRSYYPYIHATITKIVIVDGKDTDLHIDKPVYAIHLANIREAT